MTGCVNGDREPRLLAQHGTAAQPVHTIAARFSQYAPELVWREPVPTRKRDHFAGLWSPANSGSAAGLPEPDQRLDEAKLYWPSTDSLPWTVVHLVSTRYGSHTADSTRWAVFWDGTANSTMPGWLDSWFSEVLPPCPAPNAWECWSEQQPVLTLHDARRYGLPEDLIPERLRTLTATKYYSGSHLVLWRLSLPGTASVVTQERPQP